MLNTLVFPLQRVKRNLVLEPQDCAVTSAKPFDPRLDILICRIREDLLDLLVANIPELLVVRAEQNNRACGLDVERRRGVFDGELDDGLDM